MPAEQPPDAMLEAARAYAVATWNYPLDAYRAPADRLEHIGKDAAQTAREPWFVALWQAGIAEGRRQATEGWERDVRRVERMEGAEPGELQQRLKGPWEPAEPEPTPAPAASSTPTSWPAPKHSTRAPGSGSDWPSSLNRHARRPTVADDCVFCAKIAAGDVERRWVGVVCFEPLNPVTPGHMLVVPVAHVPDVAADPFWSGQAMHAAAELAQQVGDCNVITSRGAAATQTIRHLHLHVVPRRAGDGLTLPWTGQQATPPAVPLEVPADAPTQEADHA